MQHLTRRTANEPLSAGLLSLWLDAVCKFTHLVLCDKTASLTWVLLVNNKITEIVKYLLVS